MIRHTAIVLAFGGLLGIVGNASAATPVAPDAPWVSWDGATNGLDYVLGQAYGYAGQGAGTVGTSLKWISGPNQITFTRVQDTGGGSPLLLNGSNAAGANDALWSDGTPTFRVDVKYASFGQTLGWVNLNTNVAQDIVSVLPADQGINPAHSVINEPATLSNNFIWYDTFLTPWGAGTWYSDPSKNSVPSLGILTPDQMVTYRVTGTTASGGLINGGLGAYVICFEDLPANGQVASDHDYNDLVVEVAQVVPVPAAVWSGLATLGVMGAAVGMRRRARLS